VLCAIAISALPAAAQSAATATVVGQVTDPTGAVVVGANVALYDTTTNTARTTTTNDSGRYVFANVNPGSYEVRVNKEGFAAAKARYNLSIGQSLTANIALQVGSANQEVVVEASGAELQTLNATVGTTIGFRNLQELPNLSRDVSSLLTLQPAISSNGSVAGAVRDQNTFQLDGGNNSSDMDGTQNTYTGSYASSGGVTGVMPTPVESVEEFKVNVANQTADFNGSSGAQIQMVTRRGGNAWHGAAYEYYLGSNFGANTWVNKHTPTKDGSGKIISPTTALPSNHYNRFGVSGGGPLGPSLLGGKTYLFANYEGRRYPQNTTVDKTVPTPLLRLGVVQIQDASGAYKPYNLNPFPVTYNGVTYQPAACPSSPNGLCDPRGIGINSLVSQVWNKQLPLPNDATGGDTFNTQGYLTPLKLPQNDNFGVVRLDHDFGQKWKAMASYRYYHLEKLVANQYDIGGVLGGTLGVAQSTATRPQVPWFLVLGVTTQVSSRLTNDFHYNYLRNFWQWKTAGAPPQLPGLGGALEMGGEACSNIASSSSSLTPYCTRTQDARQRYWNGHDNIFRDDLTLIHNNHLLQFGGQFQRNWDAHQRNDNGLGIMAANVYQIGASSGTSSAVTGLSVNNYVPAGIPNNQVNTYRNLYAQVLGIVTQSQSLYTRTVPDLALGGFGTPVTAHSITNSYNVYISDTWHMKPTFTLTYGLGYQLELPPYETDGKQVMLVDQSGTPIRTEQYLAQRKDAALQGKVFNPIMGFATIQNVAGKPKYPYDIFYLGFSPRVAAAWNPQFDNGILGAVFGRNKTVLRGGWGRTYGRLNGVINILTPLLAPGLLQAVSCQGAVNATNAVGGNQCLGTGGANPNTAFRIGTDGMTAPLAAAVPKLPQPYLPGYGQFATTPSGDGLALDPSFRPSVVDAFNFTIQRELNSKISFEVGYLGRLINHELVDLDLNAVPYMTTLGGQSFDQAYAALYSNICGLGGGPCAGKAYSGGAQPFFEAAMGGPSSAYCTGFANCTAAVASKQASNISLGQVYNMWSGLASSTSWALGRTLPDSNPPGGCPAVTTSTTLCRQVTSIDMSLSNGYGNYHAAFATFHLRDWHGVTGASNFTWGRALGTGATTQSSSGYTVVDPWNLKMMYGPQFYDTKFLYNASMSYHLPFFTQQSGFLGRVLGGWGVAPLFTAQSGLPLEVDSGSDCQSWGESSCSTGTNENAVLLGAFPGLHQNQIVATGTAGKSGNPPSGAGRNAFADPQAVYNNFRRLVLGVDNNGGGGGRVNGFARWNLDMSITKETRFTERTGATFYALFTNVLNHFQPADPAMSIDSPSSWGVVRNAVTGSVYDPRQLELGLRIHW